MPAVPPDQRAPYGPAVLPVFVRFRDIKAAGIAGSWTQLDNFPCGVLLSSNTRAWKLADVTRWLESRPVERKAVPDRWGHQRTVEEGTR